MMPGPQPEPQPLKISKEEVAYWKKEIEAGQKRKKEEFDEVIGYENLVRYFEGFHNKIGTKIDEIAVLDEFSTALVSVINGTYYQNPTVSVSPTRPEAEAPVQPDLMFMIKNPNFKPFSRAELMKASIDYAVKKCGLKLEAQMALFDLLVAGFCVIECNHRSVPYEQDQTDMVDRDPLETIVDGAKALGEKMVEMFGQAKDGALSDAEIEEQVAKETSSFSDKFQDQTYFKRWDPNEIIFDPRARVFKESRFLTKLVKMSLADFKVYYPKFKDQVPSQFVSETGTAGTKRKQEHKKEVTVAETEIKQKDGSVNVLCTTRGINEALDYRPRAVVTNDFTMKYGCIDKYGKVYPVSRAKKAKKPQDDLNHYVTIQMEHADRSPRKVAVYMEGLSAAGKATQMNSDVYANVEKITPQPVYEAMPQQPVSIDNEKLQLAMKDSVNKHFGTSENAKAGGKSDNEFATQDELESIAFQASTSQVQDSLGDVLREVLDTLKDIIMQFWDGEDYFKVTGIVGGDQWYTPEMGPLADLLLGDYDIEIDISSAARQNPAVERANNVKLMDVLINPATQGFLASKGVSLSLQPIKNVIKSFGNNPEMVFEPLPLPPMMPPPPGAMPVPQNEPAPGEESPVGVPSDR